MNSGSMYVIIVYLLKNFVWIK